MVWQRNQIVSGLLITVANRLWIVDGDKWLNNDVKNDYPPPQKRKNSYTNWKVDGATPMWVFPQMLVPPNHSF